MVKNMLPIISSVYADAKTLGTVGELLRDAKGTDNLVEKKDMLNKAYRLLNNIENEDETYILQETINVSLEIVGNGAVLNNNMNRVITLALKTLREVNTAIEKLIK